MKKRSLKRFLITYGIIFTIAWAGFLVRWYSGFFSLELNAILWFTSFAVITTTWESLRFLHHRLNVVFPFDRSIPGRVAIQLIAGICVAVTVRFLIYKFGEPYLPIRLDTLFLASTWAIFVFGVALINSLFFVEFFIGRWKDSLVKSERLEKEKAQIQFDNLKNQLNPHFLFNALTSLNSLITDNPKLASQFLQHMSKVYRYVLQHKDKNFVNLQTELEFIRNFVFLVETRFGGNLKIMFEISQEAQENAIVPVTLQVLIENAIKHNTIDPERPLVVEVFSSGDYLVVTNNLQKRKTVETSNRLGLGNLKSLYAYMTDREVIVEQTDERFTVKVPLL